MSVELNSKFPTARNNSCTRFGPGTYIETKKRDFPKNLSFVFFYNIANKWKNYHVKSWHIYI